MKDMQMDPKGKSKDDMDMVEDEDEDDDEYPDAEREEPEMGLKRRYEAALRQHGGPTDDDDPTVARMVGNARRA